MYQLSNEKLKTCPNCAENIQADAIYCRFCERGLSKAEFKECSFCAEMIRKHANRCRFCHQDLFGPEQTGGSKGEPPAGRPPQDYPVPKVPIKPKRSNKNETSLPVKKED